MPVNTAGGGLSFSSAHLKLAQENRSSPLIQDALRLLDARGREPLEAAYLAALRAQWHPDDEEYAQLAGRLQDAADLGEKAPASRSHCQTLLGWLSVHALLPQRPGGECLRAAGDEAIEAAHANPAADPLDRIWLGALQLAQGIVFDSEALRRAGVAAYRRTIDKHIHPEGYLKGIVDVDGAARTYEAQVSGLCALAFMAEMAAPVGLDLWTYENRAVSLHTAAAYSLFYYFYPEKWRWEEELSSERTAAAIQKEGAFLEMAQRRQAMRGIEALFEEQRPLFCAYGGGLTTLTHAIAPPPKRRWRFW